MNIAQPSHLVEAGNQEIIRKSSGNRLSHKLKHYLCIYKTAELESIFIKLIHYKKSNVIIAAIYHHPNMDLEESNGGYHNPLREKSSKANKLLFMFCDFNVDLLKHDHHATTTEFLDSLLLLCSYHTLCSQLE